MNAEENEEKASNKNWIGNWNELNCWVLSIEMERQMRWTVKYTLSLTYANTWGSGDRISVVALT